MIDLSLEQQIELWRATPSRSVDYTDAFIDALIARVEELEEENSRLEGLEEYPDD